MEDSLSIYSFLITRFNVDANNIPYYNLTKQDSLYFFPKSTNKKRVISIYKNNDLLNCIETIIINKLTKEEVYSKLLEFIRKEKLKILNDL